MAQQGWTAPLGPTPGYDATAYNTSITLTDVSPVPQFTINAGTAYVGKAWRVHGMAKFSNTLTPTLLNGIYWGGVAGVKLCATAATTTTTAATNWQIQIEALIVCRSTGTAGTLLASGNVRLGTSLTAATYIPMDSIAPAVATVDTTTNKTLTWGAKWSASSASNTLTVMQWTIEDIG